MATTQLVKASDVKNTRYISVSSCFKDKELKISKLWRLEQVEIIHSEIEIFFDGLKNLQTIVDSRFNNTIHLNGNLPKLERISLSNTTEIIDNGNYLPKLKTLKYDFGRSDNTTDITNFNDKYRYATEIVIRNNYNIDWNSEGYNKLLKLNINTSSAISSLAESICNIKFNRTRFPVLRDLTISNKTDKIKITKFCLPYRLKSLESLTIINTEDFELKVKLVFSKDAKKLKMVKIEGNVKISKHIIDVLNENDYEKYKDNIIE